MTSLSTNGTFVLVKDETSVAFVWIGKNSNEFEREFATTFAKVNIGQERKRERERERENIHFLSFHFFSLSLFTSQNRVSSENQVKTIEEGVESVANVTAEFHSLLGGVSEFPLMNGDIRLQPRLFVCSIASGKRRNCRKIVASHIFPFRSFRSFL
jgi:hypothetical protein